MVFAQAPSRARRVVRKGDILVSTVRTYLKAIAVVEEDAPDLTASTGFCVVRATEIEAEYLGWVLKSDLFVDEVVSQSVGVSYPAINASTLMDIKIPLPPKTMQSKIDLYLRERASKLDAISGRVSIDGGNNALGELNKAISNYRASLILHAVSGQIEGLQ